MRDLSPRVRHAVRSGGMLLSASLLVLAILNVPFLVEHLRFAFAPPPRVDVSNTPVRPSLPPDTLAIPSLGIEAPVIEPAKKSEAAYQEALARGVAHYPGTALPGQDGNAYIFGHSSDYLWSRGAYKTVFALLPRIEQGAEILLSDASGTVYRYEVTATKVVAPDDLSVLDQGGYHRKLLTLQTSYPLGTALRRFVVNAVLKPWPTE